MTAVAERTESASASVPRRGPEAIAFRIGTHAIAGRALVAPMAGVTDRPYRQLCKQLGARYAVGEMAASNPLLWQTVKTARRIDHAGEPEPRVVQIAGADPQMMAEAARFNHERGAQVIDINMGCPAKKVCHRAAGSALMADEDLAVRIIEAVVGAVPVPVTVKMRTGTDRSNETAPRLAALAERAGVAMVTVHGRSRACGFGGTVDFDAIARVRERLTIPLVANGDIDSPETARAVLKRTGADAIMIGRAAQGRPWLYGQVDHYLETGIVPDDPSPGRMRALLREHLLNHYRFHGEWTGVRTARKHIGWTLGALGAPRDVRDRIFHAERPEDQLAQLDEYLERLDDRAASCPAPSPTEPRPRAVGRIP